LAQLIEAVDIVAWEAQPDEVHAAELFENLETALDILKDRLGYTEDNVEKQASLVSRSSSASPTQIVRAKRRRK